MMTYTTYTYNYIPAAKASTSKEAACERLELCPVKNIIAMHFRASSGNLPRSPAPEYIWRLYTFSYQTVTDKSDWIVKTLERAFAYVLTTYMVKIAFADYLRLEIIRWLPL